MGLSAWRPNEWDAPVALTDAPTIGIRPRDLIAVGVFF